jgi:phosphate starvation-inducible protein PhoH
MRYSARNTPGEQLKRDQDQIFKQSRERQFLLRQSVSIALTNLNNTQVNHLFRAKVQEKRTQPHPSIEAHQKAPINNVKDQKIVIVNNFQHLYLEDITEKQLRDRNTIYECLQ